MTALTSSPQIVAVFSRGDRVPDWLQMISPNQPTSTPGRISFNCDCAIVEWDENYIVVTRVTDKAFFIEGSSHVTIAAASKSVVIPTAWHIMFGDGHEGEGETIHFHGPRR